MMAFGFASPRWLDPVAPASQTEAMFALMQLLLSAGWVCTRSGDATSYSAVGDIVTHSGSGAGGFGNDRAWKELREPGGSSRRMTIQRVNSTTFRWKYDYGGFASGSPSANTTPSGTNEQVIRGTGTDASPTGTSNSLFASTPTTFIAGADAAAPYGFHSVGWNGSNVIIHGAMRDPIRYAPSEDIEPHIWYATATTPFDFSTLSTNSATGSPPHNPMGWIKAGLTGATWSMIPAVAGYRIGTSATLVLPHNAGDATDTNPYNGKREAFPLLYCRDDAFATPDGTKGVSSLCLWMGASSGALVSRATLNVGGRSNVLVRAGSVFLPWNGTLIATAYDGYVWDPDFIASVAPAVVPSVIPTLGSGQGGLKFVA